MLTHHVFFKYQPETSKDHIDNFCEKIHALANALSEVKSLDIGIDELHEERSWDLVLMMQFETVDDLNQYRRHPDHIAIMKFNDPFVDSIGAIDFTATR